MPGCYHWFRGHWGALVEEERGIDCSGMHQERITPKRVVGIYGNGEGCVYVGILFWTSRCGEGFDCIILCHVCLMEVLVKFRRIVVFAPRVIELVACAG